MEIRPLIGIPCYAAERAGKLGPVYGPIYANNATYVRAVERAGGVPILLPPYENPESAAMIYARLDGLLLAGGGDVDPAIYGQERLPECQEPEAERDALELTLTRRALEDELPVFGICRGMQVLNVARGGTLIQDIATAQPEAQRHPWTDHPRDHRAHEIAVEDSSRLAGIVGRSRLAVNSLHHQAIDRPGAGVRVLAYAPDGIAEAMEVEGQPFALAVQFHPEELAPTDEASRRLFEAFVRACRERMRT